MPYLPDLISQDQKIIPEYFHKQPINRQKPKTDVGAILLAVLFLSIALYFIRYVGFAALFGLLALSCTNGGRRWLEKVGRFSLTGAARVVIYGAVVLVSVPVYLSYAHQDEADAAARVAAHERAVRFTADSLVKDSSRKVALYAALQTANQAIPEHGLSLLATAGSLVKTTAEKDSVQVVDTHLRSQLLQQQLDKRNYRAALTTVNQLLANERKPKMWFYRARCYIGLDSMQLAVNDLDSARDYQPAKRLYEKVNPEKRRITGYCTLCADGSISYATGRGACSWHGGVAEWNHPIYETYRKY